MKVDRRAQRWAVLLLALGVASWLALFGDRQPGRASDPMSGVVHPTARAIASSARASSPAAPVAIEQLRPRVELARSGTQRVPDLFAPAPWTLLPARSAATVATTARSEGPEPLPPLPYRFIGKKLEAGRWEVYLSRDDASAIVREGATLDASYRVDRIEPPTLWLTHLPSGKPQTLMIGDMP